MNLDYNFDWNYIKAGSPYITISSLAISFNSLAIKQLKDPKYIMIGFDEERLVIGVKGVEAPVENMKTYEFTTRKNKDGWIRIGCKEFIQRLEHLTGHEFSEAKRFSTKVIENDMLIIEISKENKE
jgi:hypothetical protein